MKNNYEKESFSEYGWPAYEEIWTGVHYNRSHLKKQQKTLNTAGIKTKLIKKTSCDTGANVFRFLSTLPLLPQATTAVFGSYRSSFGLN